MVLQELLKANTIRTDIGQLDKWTAIERLADLIVDSGKATDRAALLDAILNREKQGSTGLGNGIAIPHGEAQVKDAIRESGIVVLQYPQGVQFGKDTAHLVVGIAGKDNDHLSILANIAATMDECSEAELEKLYNTKDPKVLYERFAAAN